jgi:hypothetical protein
LPLAGNTESPEEDSEESNNEESMTIIMMIGAITMSKTVTSVAVGQVASLEGPSDDIIEMCMAFL